MIKKRVLITGVSSGVGFALAESLLAKGWLVTGLARRATQCFQPHDDFSPVDVDLAELDQLTGCLPDLKKLDFDAVVCCAGFGRFGCIEEFSLAQIQQLMDVNFTSHAWLLRHLVPQMKRAGQGDIVIIGSESALSGGKKGAIYCASKFALRGFAQALRDECSRNGLRVSLINPGMVDTAFFDQLDFTPGKDPENAILAENVVSSIQMVLDMPANTVVDEINLSPLKKVVAPRKK